MTILDDDGLNGSVDTATLKSNGYSEEEYEPGKIIRYEERNVIFHVYIDNIRKDTEEVEWADFMVYWPN